MIIILVFNKLEITEGNLGYYFTYSPFQAGRHLLVSSKRARHRSKPHFTPSDHQPLCKAPTPPLHKSMLTRCTYKKTEYTQNDYEKSADSIVAIT